MTISDYVWHRAWVRGTRAFMNDPTKTMCPYEPSDMRHDAWCKGWQDAQDVWDSLC